MSDEYNHVPLKIVDHKELHQMGTAARIAELEAQIHAAGLPCDCWDSRCTQYAILLRRASFLMQTASQGDADMRKFIAEVERLVGSPSSSDKLSTPPSLSDGADGG
jgi:hypothetical protein